MMLPLPVINWYVIVAIGSLVLGVLIAAVVLFIWLLARKR
jgi:hypothetical protein